MGKNQFNEPPDLAKDWETVVLTVQKTVRKHCTSPKPSLDQLTGDLILGDTTFKPNGSVKQKGLGLGSNKRGAIRTDLNFFLLQVSKNPKMIGTSQLGEETTLRDVATLVWNNWK